MITLTGFNSTLSGKLAFSNFSLIAPHLPTTSLLKIITLRIIIAFSVWGCRGTEGWDNFEKHGNVQYEGGRQTLLWLISL